MRVIRALLLLTMVAVLALNLACDDPQTAIFRIFARQGLTLLQPARDYITIGGIVVLPHGSNTLQYLDPSDSLIPAAGTSTNFQAVIANQTDTTTTAAQVAFALTKIISLPIGFSFNNGPQTVKLTQINASGQRYTSPMISTLLKKHDTAEEINRRLNEHDRVFVIQEVYTATSLSVSASSNMALQANVGGSPVNKQCGTGQQAGGQQTGGTQAGGQQAGGTQAGGQQAGGQQAGGTQVGGQQAGGQQTGGTQAGGQQAGGQQAGGTQAGGQQTGGQQGVAVDVCRNTDAELSFTSQTAIPFAVRLNEVQPGPGGVLQVKLTDFHLPNLALGNSSDVAATALIDAGNPTILLPAR